MKYEIAYVSLSGNTEKLAHSIADALPHNETFVTDLKSEKITGKADIYLLCFGVNKGAVPFAIMDALEKLEGKTILFFVTAGFEPEKEYRTGIQNKIKPFLPDKCNYKGLFVCPGAFPDEVIVSAKAMLEKEPNNRYAKKIIEDAELSANHPNAEDVQNAIRFLKMYL